MKRRSFVLFYEEIAYFGTLSSSDAEFTSAISNNAQASFNN
jgi:hypothetical protein